MNPSFWLFKSEPETYSIDDLRNAPDQTTCWEGVRNYQARNLLRDKIQLGDRVLFYHSACAQPAVVGTAIVVREGYPDHHAWDTRHHYFDPKSDPGNPRWFMVDVQFESKFSRPVTLAEIRATKALAKMELLRKGSRLSIQPVRKTEFDRIVQIAERM